MPSGMMPPATKPVKTRARNSVSKSALVCYFFDKIEGSLEALDKNLEDVLKQKLNQKQIKQ